MNKFEHVKEIVSRCAGGDMRLLDVGCRDCVLKEHLDGMVQYSGLDLFQNPQGTVDYVHNAEKGLPVESGSFDFVVALDFLEHLNELQAGLVELLRASRKTVIVVLPNAAYVLHRLTFLWHGCFTPQTKKYDLRYTSQSQTIDRHRWLTVQHQADEFMRRLAEDRNLDLEIRWIYESRKRERFGKICRALDIAPSWWVPSSLYILTKQD